MKPKYRVVNLTGSPVMPENFLIRDGENFYDEIPESILEFINSTDRFFVEVFHSGQEIQSYRPESEVSLVAKGSDESESESETKKTDETPDTKNDPPETPEGETGDSEPGVTKPEIDEKSDNPEEVKEIDPKLAELLEMTNDDAADAIADIEDKDFLQSIIDAEDVKSGTKSAAVRRLKFLNAD